MTRLSPYLFAAFLLALWAPSSTALAASDAEKRQVFQASETYTATGTVAKIDDDDLEMKREGLPKAEFEIVEGRTEIFLDGTKVSYRELARGMSVRATFQIAGDDLIATRIEAQSAQPGGGSQR